MIFAAEPESVKFPATKEKEKKRKKAKNSDKIYKKYFYKILKNYSKNNKFLQK